jgi:hypothetical protein
VGLVVLILAVAVSLVVLILAVAVGLVLLITCSCCRGFLLNLAATVGTKPADGG